MDDTQLYRVTMLMITLGFVMLIAIAVTIGLTLSNTSTRTRDMYRACIETKHSPADCRDSVNNWHS